MMQPIIVEVQSVRGTRICVKSAVSPVEFNWETIEESFLCMGDPPYDDRLPILDRSLIGQKLILTLSDSGPLPDKSDSVYIIVGSRRLQVFYETRQLWSQVPKGIFVE